VHCTASPNGVPWDIQKIREDHIKHRGFHDVGYHVVIQPSGDIQWGRPLEEEGAHVKGHNKDNIGIALIGLDKFSLIQLQCLRNLYYSIPSLVGKKGPFELHCHYEFDSAKEIGKTCPNMKIDDLKEFIINKNVGTIVKYLLP
jgi:hypothetical protein